MAINIVANLGSAGTTEVALPLFARVHLHAGAGGYGALIASAGIGAVAGSLVAARFNSAQRPAVAAGGRAMSDGYEASTMQVLRLLSRQFRLRV